MFLPMLRDGKHEEEHENIREAIHKGCSIVPLSSTVRGQIADVYQVDPEKFSHLDDKGILNLAFKALDDPRTIQALVFHAGVVSGVYGGMSN